MTESDIAWAAGVFEGEGSVGVSGKSKAPVTYMSMGMSEQDVLDRFTSIVGTGKVYGPYKGQGSKTPAHYKPMFHWKIRQITEIQRILRLFYPYLGERRRSEAAGVIASYYETLRLPQRARKAY